MVDYSLVWLDSPSISFFFTRLYFFLQTSSRRKPKVGVYVTQKTPLREVLLSLYPLVHFSVCFAQFLEERVMSEEKVKSSDLETGLSSSEKTIAQEMDTALSLAITFQAWKEKCGYSRKDHEKTRDRIVSKYQFPPLALDRLPELDERAYTFLPKEVCFYESYFQCGLHFPIHPFYREVLFHLKIAPAQLIPNVWRTMMCCMVIWSTVNDGDFIKVDEFLYSYRLMESKLKGYWEFRPWDKKSKIVLESPSFYRDWKQRFFFILGEGWETLSNENLDEALRFLCQWGTPVSGASFYAPFFHFLCIVLLMILIVYSFFQRKLIRI